jgi:LPXTG-motif cell wall-anchored protein
VGKVIRTVLGLMAVALTLVVAAPAAHAQYQNTPTLTVDKPTAPAGSTVLVCGTNFLPNTTVSLSVGSSSIGQAQTDAAGAFCFPWDTATLSAGTYVVTATDGRNTLSVTVVLTAGGTTAPTGTLPYTGSESGTFARAGAALVAVGALLVLVTRRRLQRVG